MKKLLVLSLLIMVGCETYVSEWDLTGAAHREERLPMLRDGRIHIGMTANRLAELWDRPRQIDRSTHRYGTTEWWWFDRNCEPTYSGYRHSIAAFCFENGILTYWSEN